MVKHSVKINVDAGQQKISRRTEREESKFSRPSFAAERPSLPVLGSEAARVDPLRQSGVLAYRRLENGELVVLLVRKRTSNGWGIPKGNAEPHLSLADNAAKEAFEEAGVSGRIDRNSAGTYRAVKRVNGLKLVVEVCVYLLEVLETARKWPEKHEREIKWCSPHEAGLLLHEPLLTELCGRLIQREHSLMRE